MHTPTIEHVKLLGVKHFFRSGLKHRLMIMLQHGQKENDLPSQIELKSS